MKLKLPVVGKGMNRIKVRQLINFCFLFILLSTNALAQVLDVLPAASAAYSLRKLQSNYTSISPGYPVVAGSSYVPTIVSAPAIRVRRTSDDALQDIGFSATGDLNTVALLDFIGGPNLFTYSEQLNNTAVWSGVGSTITANGAIAPNSSMTAELFNETASNNEHFVDYNYTTPQANSMYSMSLYVKPIDNTSRLIIIRGVFADGTSSSYMSFNLNTGTYVNSVGGRWINPSITALPSGWYLLRGTYTTVATIPAATDLVFRVQYMVDNPLANVYPGNAAISTALWGAQLQPGSTFLGYTPTLGVPQLVVPTGYVHTWFDQTGNARHITQINQDNQPMIVDTGVIVRGPNGKVTVNFWGDRAYTASSFLTNNAATITASSSTINMVTRWLSLTGVGNTDLPFGIGTTNDTRRGRFFYRSNNNMVGWSAWGCDVTGTVINPDPGGAIHTYNAIQVGSALTMAKDGVEYNFTLPNIPLTPSTGIAMGQLNNPSQTSNYFTEMELSEAIVFASALLPAERRILQCDQGSYYGSPTTIAGLDFYVGAVTDQTSCKLSSEKVVWNSATVANATVATNNLTKINTISWDGGAASLNTVSNNGYVEFRAVETNKARMLGLSTSFTGVNYLNIQFAVYLRSNGMVDVYESGISRGPSGSFGNYSANDLFRIAIESGTIRYYKNGVLFYTSLVAPVAPMIVHVSMADIGATVSQVTVSNPCSGTFMANASNTGPNPIYQWQLNGVNTGTNSNTYTNPNLTSTNLLTCSITLDGCASNSVISNSATLINSAPNPSLQFYIRSLADTGNCKMTSEQIAWRFISLDNGPRIQTTPTSITKISGTTWDAGGASLNQVNNNGYFQFTATLTSKALMGGLSNTITGISYTNIQYAIYLANNGSLQIFESGTNKGTFGNYAVGDVMRVAIEGGRVNYYRNNILFYTSTIAPTLPQFAHVSIADPGGSIINLSIYNRSGGLFTATVLNGPANPTYNWTVNGVSVQSSTSSNYSNPTLNVNDVVACTLQLTGCFTNTYTSNTITTILAQPSPSISFYIAGVPDQNGCRKAGEQVVWKFTALSNQERLTLAANTATKRLSNGWDAVAVSYNQVYNNGYLEFKALEINKNRIIGLSNSYTTNSYPTVQYGIYLQSSATIGIYESGNNRGNFGTYAANDIFRVAVDNNVVRYYKNGVVFFTSSVTAVLPMMAQAALNEIGATAAEMVVWNLNNGAFNAYAINTTSPLNYTWKTNAVANGGNSATYTNPSLATGSILTCDLSFQTCFSTILPSNQIIIQPAAPNPSLAFYIQGVPDSTACWLAGEQAVWSFTTLSDQQRLSITPTLVTKTSSTAWDAAIISYNQVVEGGYFEFRVAEINKARTIGLSTAYTGNAQAAIQYGIYLQNSATLSIIEAGVNRGTFNNYTATDTFRIAIEQGKVRYYKNSVLFYTSNTVPSLPLRANATFYDVGSTLLDPVIWNPNRGYFNAIVINGSLPANYQWKLNGVVSGPNTSQYINPTMVAGDVLQCDLQLVGCLNNTVTSNIIRRRAILPNPALSFFIRGEVEQNSCRMAGEEVVWNNFTNFQDLSRVVRSRNNLTKQLTTGWDGGAASLNRVYNNGYVEFTASETNKGRMLGLSSSYTTSSYTGIQYAFYLQTGGILGIYESGVSRGNFGTYATGDILRIHIQIGTIKYYKNGTLVYTSTITPSLPLLVYASLNDIGATLTNVMVYNYNNGDFVAIAQQTGNDVTYTWMVNGIVVQTGRSISYTNTSLAVGDQLTCQISLGGCLAGNNYLSNRIIISTAPQLTPDFFIEGQRVYPSCSIAIEQVMWSNSDMTGNMSAVNVNSLLKTTGNGVWDGGAASLNKVKDRGYFEFTATENNKLRAVGLTTINSGADQNSINFCFYLQNDGFYRIYESGADRGLMGTYAPGSVFRIGIDNGILKYYKDGILVYISTVAPALPIMADVSINEAGGTVTNAIVVNYNNGTFVSNIPNGGTYTWMINSNIILTNNQSSFIPSNLQYNDTIRCILNSNLPGCTPQVINSNYIIYRPAVSDSADFYIGANGSASGCHFTIEQVKWKASEVSAATMTVRSDNSLLKLQSPALWNGGAASWNKVYNNGYLEFVATENNKAKVLGLSNTYLDASLATVQFGILLQSTGAFRVYESNNDRGGFGNYVAGDIFKIWVDNLVVRYYRNNVLFYISNLNPSPPLYVDASIYDIGGTIGKAEVANYTNGTFQAYSVNAGSGATYSWKVNNVVVQNSTLSSYTNTSLLRGDTVRCTLTSGIPGCTPFAYQSNYVVVSNTLPALSDFAITSEPATATCALVTEPVRWKISDLSRDASVVNGNGLIRMQNTGWNCGAFSWNKVHNNGYFEFKALETNKPRIIGLSSTNPNADWSSIQFAFYLTSSATFDIRQSGNTIAIPGATYAMNDVFRIAVESNVVKYYKNGILVYVSGTAPALPLMVDVSLYDAGATVSNAVITNLGSGNFTANTFNLGTGLNYTWSVNSVTVQTGPSVTYTNLSLQNNDTVRCVASSALSGCSSSPFTSNIIINTITAVTNIDFAIRGIAVPTSCSMVREDVKWKKSDLTTNMNVANVNQLVKTGTINGWDGGAASWNTVSNNGYFECIAAETNKNRMIGLSTTNTGFDQTTIRYGFLLENNSSYRIYEAGSYAGITGTYATGDTFRISVESNVVRYYKSSIAVYNSLLVPTLPLLVDVSIFEPGGTVQSPVVVNYNGGQFEAVSLNAGASPTYQWSVNGATVQNSVSATYTNNSLNNNDLVKCQMTANLAGCVSNAPLISNDLRNIIIVPTNVDAYVKGVPVTTSCNVLYEEVKWKTSDLANVSATTNNLLKIQSDGSWDGGAASWNTVSMNGGFQFTVTENNKARMAGLSVTNANSNYTSIAFAYHLLATGELRIVESGVDRGFTSSYLPGDILRLSVELVAGQNKVRYYKNNQILFTSVAVATTLPLMADISIFNQGGTITDAIIYNPHNGGYVAGASNAGAANYEWKVNGVTVQNGLSANYTNVGLSNNDVVTCIITPGLTGCSAITFSSNRTIVKLPLLVITPPAPVCSPLTIDLTVAAITAGTAPDMTISYWSDAAGTVLLSNPRDVGAGTYYIKATRFGTCNDIKPVTVVIRAAPTGSIIANNPELNCNTTSLQLSASGSSAFRWDDFSVSATRTVSQPGTYYAVFTDAYNCSTTINQVVFRNIDPPLVSILGNTSPICQGASVDLVAVPATFNNALRLDGNSQSADLGNWFNYRNFTIEFWLKPSSVQSPYATIIDNNYSFTGLSWTVAQNNAVTNQYSFACYTPLGSASVLFNLTANTWQHVTLVKSSTALTVYLNGVQISTTAWTLGNILYDGTQSLRLGRWAGGTRFWNGQIDELRIFNTAVPAAQIATDMTTNYPQVTANLKAYYKMDQPDNSPTVVNSTTTAYGTGPALGNPNFIASGVTVSNSFTYAWWPGGSTTNSTSAVPSAPVTYLTTVTGNNGCPRVESTELTVSMSSLGNIVSTPSVCQGSSAQVTFHAVGANPPYTFYYSVNGVNATVTTSTTADSVTVTPPTNVPGTFQYELQNLVYANASFCLQSQSGSATVIVHSNPVVTVTPPAAVCAPGAVNLTLPAVTTGSTPGLTYTYWTTTALTNALATPTAVDSAATYYIQGIESVYGCSSVQPVTVTIRPQPIMNAIPDDTICSGSGVIVNLSATIPSTYSWSTFGVSSGLSGASSGNGSTLSQTLTQTGNTAPGQVFYRIVPVSTAYGCTGPADTIHITVSAMPGLLSTQDSSGCTSASVTLGATSSAGTVQWYSAATGGSLIGNGSTFQTPVISTTTTYYAEAVNNGCSNGVRVPVIATIERPGQWLGYTNNWDTPTNWGCRSVPTTTTDVTIPTTPIGGNYPTVSSNNTSVCRNLTMQPTASVTVTPAFDLGVYGDITNNGVAMFGGGTLRFSGSVLQHIIATATQQVGSIMMSNSWNNNSLRLLTDVIVTEAITFNDGIIDLNGKTLTLGTNTSNGNLSGAGTGKHINSINGYFIRHTNTNISYTFPLGDSLQYTPIELNIHSGTQTGAVIRSKVTRGKQPNLAATNYLNRYWSMEPTGLLSGIDYDATYTYFDPTEIIGSGTLYPVKYSISSGIALWSSCPGSGIINITGSSGSHNVASKTFIWNNLSSFSDFTGANTSQPLPVELLYFRALADLTVVHCSWVTMSELNNDFFTVERSRDAINFDNVGTISGSGTSSSVHSYDFTDEEPFDGISYYRLRQTDFDGKSTVSQIEVVKFNQQNELTLTHCKSEEQKLFITFNNDTYLKRVAIYDLAGRIVFTTDVETRGSTYQISIPGVAAGCYSLYIQTTDGEFLRKKFIQN